MEKIEARTIIEVAGFPKEHVENSAKKLIETIKNLKDLKVETIELAEVKEVKNMWSTFLEAELKFNDIESMVEFCFNFMPSSIEILEPSNFRLEQRELANLMNDLLRRLHNYSMAISGLVMEKKVLEKKLSSLQKS